MELVQATNTGQFMRCMYSHVIRRRAWPSGRALDLYSGGPGLKSLSLPLVLDGFVISGPEFNSFTPCK